MLRGNLNVLLIGGFLTAFAGLLVIFSSVGHCVLYRFLLPFPLRLPVLLYVCWVVAFFLLGVLLLLLFGKRYPVQRGRCEKAFVSVLLVLVLSVFWFVLLFHLLCPLAAAVVLLAACVMGVYAMLLLWRDSLLLFLLCLGSVLWPAVNLCGTVAFAILNRW